jgi:hypothetical protein
MADIRKQQARRRAGATLVMAAAAGGLLAAALAGSPTARADDLTDILNDSQGAITLGEADYTTAGTDFSTAGDTNEGLIASFIGFDNIFVSPGEYALLGLTGEATGTDIGTYSSYFDFYPDSLDATTAAGQEAFATAYSTDATTYFADASSALTSGDYFDAVYDYLSGDYASVLAGQADTLAALFSAGI